MIRLSFFIFVFVSVLNISAQSLIFSGSYLWQGLYINRKTNQQVYTGAQQIWNFSFYTDRVVVNTGTILPLKTREGTVYHYTDGSSNGKEVIWDSNYSSMVIWMEQTNNAMSTFSLQSGGFNTQGYSGGAGGSSGRQCEFCGGSGRCSFVTSPYNKDYCQGNRRCAHCGGSGYVSNPYGGSSIKCSFCNTSGWCGFCNGTGRCSHCCGTGRR